VFSAHPVYEFILPQHTRKLMQERWFLTSEAVLLQCCNSPAPVDGPGPFIANSNVNPATNGKQVHDISEDLALGE